MRLIRRRRKPTDARERRRLGWRVATACLAPSVLAMAADACGWTVAPHATAQAPFEAPPTAVITQRAGISLEEAVAIALSRYPGRVVRTETNERGGRRIHEIRILGDENRVHIVRIDAQTGRFL